MIRKLRKSQFEFYSLQFQKLNLIESLHKLLIFIEISRDVYEKINKNLLSGKLLIFHQLLQPQASHKSRALQCLLNPFYRSHKCCIHLITFSLFCITLNSSNPVKTFHLQLFHIFPIFHSLVWLHNFFSFLLHKFFLAFTPQIRLSHSQSRRHLLRPKIN